jgi:hypothetical protein
VILAILIALMAFTGATIIALQVQHDMQTAQLGAKQAARRMAVKGAVNHLLSMLRRGVGTEYDEESPLKLTVGPVEDISVWTVPDSIFPDVRHIRAEFSGITFTKTVVARPVRDSKEFFEHNNNLFSRTPGDPNWTSLPSPPTTGYNFLGQSVTIDLPPVGTAEISDIEAGEDGQLVATVYQPDPSGGFQGVHVWNDDTQAWSTLPPLPTFSFGISGLELGTTFDPYQVDGITEQKIYSVTSGGLAIYDLDQQQWNYHSLPSLGHREKFSATGGGKLVVAMKDSFTSNRWLNVFDDGSWSNIPIGSGSQLPHLELTPRGVNSDGEVFGAKYDSGTSSWLTQFYGNGQWQTMSVPNQVSGLELRDVDASGALVYSDGTTDLAVWNEKENTVEVLDVPAGTSIYPTNVTEGRQVAGGGNNVDGVPPELKVVSSF